MTLSIPTSENFKDKAKIIRSFMKEKCGADISHSHSLELLSQLFGCKDWNTAKAALTEYERVKALASIRSKKNEIPASVKGFNMGELRKATAEYPDEATVEFDYEFNLGEFMNSIDDLQSPEDTIHQEFAITALKKVDNEYATLTLALKEESFSSPR